MRLSFCDLALILPVCSAYPTLHLYWDRVPDSYYRETEGTSEYKRRDAVRVATLVGLLSVAL